MKTYVVGGAVRDELLGLPVKDRDWVVVGASPQEMLDRGFKPVGKDFPVFLHPKTHEEYALARTERKVSKGYTGFTFHAAPDVTLEQDLARRDLTINAIARGENGELIDPFHGCDDLKAGILRHVSSAFVEDPVRILRLARFAARFHFGVAPETLALMREMVANGEVDALVPERVWQEFAKGLMEDEPSRMLLALRDCGALKRLIPEIDVLFETPKPGTQGAEENWGVHAMRVIDRAAEQGWSLAVRWAALLCDVGRPSTPEKQGAERMNGEAVGVERVLDLCSRLKVPSYCRDLARLSVEFKGQIQRAPHLSAARTLRLLQRCDAFRKPDRFGELLQACSAAVCSETSDNYPQARFLQGALQAAAGIDSGAIAAHVPDKAKIPLFIARERLLRLRAFKKQWNAV